MNIQQAKTEKTKQKILKSVYQIVKKEGVHAISSTNIIKTAKISKGRFFHHFHQVEDLYLYILDSFVEKLGRKIPPEKFESFQEFINNYVEYSFTMLRQSPEEASLIFYFVGHCQHNQKYRNKFKNIIKNSFDEWTNRFPARFKLNLSKEKKQRLLRLLDVHLVGLSFHYLIVRNKEISETINSDFISMIINFVNEDNLV
ncbi:hypothetical protein fh0823_13040 [Francisella halioticida]|uniref:HTH tetR-type domain-containing protein n=1 Tax=Francisella halioticida TaxID=549298 RepID=A0ABM6M0I1_9GAMM|nr:TetR/AcrR family transcriptional regulator [Francisella halioticida]ASG68321.1 hypothetical protein CDV26_07905 [Francisella halioticida]BCD91165.1 hypothetical protein fh0823_13040 [Francisella halioticida]